MNVCKHILGGICTLVAEDQGGLILQGTRGCVCCGVSRLNDISRPALHSLGFYLGGTSGS